MPYFPSNTSSSGAMVKLAAADLAADAATIDFTSISGSYRALRIEMIARITKSAVDDWIYVQFNGDTGNNYWDQEIRAIATSVSGMANNAQAKGKIGYAVGATGRTDSASVITFDIPFYATTTFEKTIISNHGEMYTTGNMIRSIFAVRWGSTAAITSIKFLLSSDNFLAGTKATLYGLT